jgi:hypothetical protein
VKPARKFIGNRFARSGLLEPTSEYVVRLGNYRPGLGPALNEPNPIAGRTRGQELKSLVMKIQGNRNAGLLGSVQPNSKHRDICICSPSNCIPGPFSSVHTRSPPSSPLPQHPLTRQPPGQQIPNIPRSCCTHGLSSQLRMHNPRNVPSVLRLLPNSFV